MKIYSLDLDKIRELRFGFKSLAIIHQKWPGRHLEALLQMDVHEMPWIAHAGLVWAENALTVEQVIDLLDEAIPKKYTITGAMTLILEALAAHMGVDMKKFHEERKKALASEPEVAVAEKKADPKLTTLSSRKRKK